jgi:exodeoxyribonuclease VII small subunit
MSEAERDVEALTFEEAFHELEKLVEQLEAGSLPLEDTIRLFERGSLLAKRCQTLLDQFGLRVQHLTEDEEGKPVVQPFEPED